MENDEKATFNEIFVRSLTFRKTGHFKNVKDDGSLSLKIFLASAFVIFMFEVPLMAGVCRKYPITWAISLALISLISNPIFVLVLSGIAAFCLAVAGRHRRFGFLAIYNVVAISLIQSMLIGSCIHLLMAAVGIFDTRPLNWMMFLPNRVGIWILCPWLVVLAVNVLMIFVNLASVRHT